MESTQKVAVFQGFIVVVVMPDFVPVCDSFFFSASFSASQLAPLPLPPTIGGQLIWPPPLPQPQAAQNLVTSYL